MTKFTLTANSKINPGKIFDAAGAAERFGCDVALDDRPAKIQTRTNEVSLARRTKRVY